MSDVPATTASDAQQALLALHSLAGTYGSKDPTAGSRLRTANTGSNLRTLASASPDLVPASTRIGVLYRLAQAGYPEREQFEQQYQALASTVAKGRVDLAPGDLLEDLRTAATDTGLSASQTIAASAHHEVAFLGQDVCSVRRVTVDGRDAVWIFSEFETDAPFENVARWVDPRSWPVRSPLLFRRMEIVGADRPVDISDGGAPGVEHWHSVFHEEVQLVRDVNTLLHCDFRRDGTRSAAMTYELAFSPDNEINVDRGFLLVNELAGMRHVKALKIVGFVDQGWNDVAERVCPIWTDFIRQAVDGGHQSGSLPPGHIPPGTPTTPPITENLEPWIQFFGESAMTYLHLFDDVTTRVSRGGYSSGDLVQDGRRYWSQLAKDWARAWTTGTQALGTIAEQGLDAGVPPPTRAAGAGGTGPGPAGSTAGARFAAAAAGPAPAADGAEAGTTGAGRGQPEGTTIPVAGLGEGEALGVSALVSIEAGAASIPAAEVTVTRVALPNGNPGVRLETRNRTAPPGLYVGELTNAAGERLSSVQLYLSRATGS